MSLVADTVPRDTRPWIVVGAGLTGSMMAALLGRAGHSVLLLERRGDPRTGPVEGGRSINLALSARGLHALGQLGLEEQILRLAVPLYGRMIHSTTAELAFQPYGAQRQAINSFSRAALNLALVDAAAAQPGVALRFNRRVVDLDLDRGVATHVDADTGAGPETSEGVVVGADGAYSVIRAAMQRREHHDYSQAYLAHGYKELVIPPGADGRPVLEPNALHIWPRGGFMMMAMANPEGSFTVTVYLPMTGPSSFAELATEAAVVGFFQREFPDAVPLIPDLAASFLGHPTGAMVTVRTWPWRVGDRVVLIGDAAHAIVPFYGQGANAGFEDCLALLDALEQHPSNRGAAFEAYQGVRKPNTEAIADLAVVNFLEMRDHVGSRRFLWRKRAEHALARLLPRWYVPLYTLISFSLVPYAEARARARRQAAVVRAVAGAIAIAAALAVVLSVVD